MNELMDRTLTCQACGAEFPFTAEEQEFFQSKGFQEPKKCKPCRQAAKAQRQGGGYGRQERQLYDVQCAACGQMTQVPFRPKGDRPVYCKPCYSDQAGGSY